MNLEVCWPLGRDHYLTIPDAPTSVPWLTTRLSFQEIEARCMLKLRDDWHWFTATQIAHVLEPKHTERATQMVFRVLAAMYDDGRVERRVAARLRIGTRPFEYRWAR